MWGAITVIVCIWLIVQSGKEGKTINSVKDFW